MAHSDGMKKMMMAAAVLGMTGLLAACDSSGSAPDGSASGRIESTRTEYRTQNGAFVACDNVINAATGREKQTQVAVRFVLAGTIESVKIGLKGNSNDTYDDNFTKTVTGAELAKLGNGSYKVLFNADSGASNSLLPQSIVVNPVQQKVKTVTASNKVGSFYVRFDIKTGSSDFILKDQTLGSIPVYSTCTVTATTDEDV